jgi:hypothetical protein
MSFDTSRFTFNSWSNYNGVVMEQGRVQLDSDWNEWLAELQRRLQAGTLDTLGFITPPSPPNAPHCAVYPATTPWAFMIQVVSNAGGTFTVYIGPGRMYVDGILAENHGNPSAITWDPALAEMSNTPQPPQTSFPTAAAIDFTQQTLYPGATLPDIANSPGPYLFYLDVWTRPVTYLEDPELIDPAVNVDTTGRLQTVWQVKCYPNPLNSGTNCSNLPASAPWEQVSTGQLSNNYVGTGTAGPCCMTSTSGYTGLENQLYRVEIHQTGLPATSSATAQSGDQMATFKWSRDNGSVQTGVTNIQTKTNSLNNSAAQLKVMSLGRDQVLGFAPGNWIELIDDYLELSGGTGELHMIDTVDPSNNTIMLVDMLQNSGSFPVDSSGDTTATRHTRIIRWDQSGQVYLSIPASGSTPASTTSWYDPGANGARGDIPVPPPGSYLILENGITIQFGPENSTQFNTGDYWSFAARASNGQIDPLVNATPFGIHHHYAPLSVVTFSPLSSPDCRVKWPPSTGEGSCGCCNTYTVGTNGDYTTIQAAINALPTTGGEIQILPGRYYENVLIQGMKDVVIRGCGDQTRVASAVLAPGSQEPPAEDNLPATVKAVFSVSSSLHIKFQNFAVEAANNEAGFLIDGTGYLIVPPPPTPPPGSSTPSAPTGLQAQPEAKVKAGPQASPKATLNSSVSFIDIAAAEFLLGDIDIAIEEMVVTASNLPAIFAKRVSELNICDCRLAMENVKSTYAAVWMSGENIVFARNWVGLQTEGNVTDYLPSSVAGDLLTDAKNSGGGLNYDENPIHPGGIQIGGNSTDVEVVDNQIVGGLRNGITLGSYAVLDANKEQQLNTPGVTMTESAADEETLVAPTTFSGIADSTIVSLGPLEDITIAGNTISDFGLAGIGPVGFFNIEKTFEIIAADVLRITGNTISNTVGLTRAASTTEFLACGAITLATSENVLIRDNLISVFGNQPGLGAAGIFLLHGETVEISRNQIVDNRDWNDPSTPDQVGNSQQLVGAIDLVVVTPPTLASDATGFLAKLEIFEPGLPALRIQDNLVRVPLGTALFVLGFGTFEITGNHFSCGGNIPGTSSSELMCVDIVNLGYAIELISPTTPSGAYSGANGGSPPLNNNPTIPSSSGAVLFTNNMCQLELREVPQTGFASVVIITFDHLIFSNNHCWVDGAGLSVAGAPPAAGASVLTDAFLLAGSLNVTSNRFQEGQDAADISAWTIGLLNITSQNIATYCILAEGVYLVDNNNLSILGSIAPGLCEKLNQR